MPGPLGGRCGDITAREVLADRLGGYRVLAPSGGGPMVQVPRTRLEQHAQIVRLSVREFVDRFHAVAIECGEGRAHISERQAKRWFAGESDLPRPVCRRVLERWWAEPVSRLLGPPDSGRAAAIMSAEELIVNSGQESVHHAIKGASGGPAVISLPRVPDSEALTDSCMSTWCGRHRPPTRKYDLETTVPSFVLPLACSGIRTSERSNAPFSINNQQCSSCNRRGSVDQFLGRLRAARRPARRAVVVLAHPLCAPDARDVYVVVTS